MPTLPLDPEIKGSATRLQKSREVLTKDFDPDQPRDPHSGRWIDVGDVVSVSGFGLGRVTGHEDGKTVVAKKIVSGDTTKVVHDRHSRAELDRYTGRQSGSGSLPSMTEAGLSNRGRWTRINHQVVALKPGEAGMINGARVRRNEDKSFDVASGNTLKQGITGIHATNIVVGSMLASEDPEKKSARESRVEFDTRSEEEYRFTHGREPKGRGQWMFDIDGDVVSAPALSTYAEARKWAEAEAKNRGGGTVKVLT